MNKLVLSIALVLLAAPTRADIIDVAAGGTVHLKCTTANGGVPTTLAGSPVVSIYKDNSLAQSTAGVTLLVDFDGITGLSNVAVDTSADGAFYAAASMYEAIVTTGTVGGISAVGYSCGAFSIQRQTVAAVVGSVGSVASGGITSASFGAAAIDAAAIAPNAIGSSEVADGAIDAGAIATDAVDADALAANAVTEIAAGITSPSAATIADAVHDELLSGHTTPGSAGAALTAAGGSADPLLNDPCAYATDTAGYALCRIGVGSGVTVSSPVATVTQALTIKQGDDYSLTDTHSIDFSYSGTYDPSSPTSITLKIYTDPRRLPGSVSEVASWTGTVVGSSSPWTLRFQPTALQTAAVDAGSFYRYDIEVVKAARKVTVGTGNCSVTVD